VYRSKSPYLCGFGQDLGIAVVPRDYELEPAVFEIPRKDTPAYQHREKARTGLRRAPLRTIPLGDDAEPASACRQPSGEGVTADVDKTHGLVGQLGHRRMIPQPLRGPHDLLVAVAPGPGTEDVAHCSADDQSRSKTHCAIMPGPKGYFTTRSCGVRLSRSPPPTVITTGSETK